MNTKTRTYFTRSTADVIALARKGDAAAREELTHRKCPSARLALKELAGDKSVHQEVELRVKRATGKATAKDLAALEKIKAEKKAARAAKIAEAKKAAEKPAKATKAKAAKAGQILTNEEISKACRKHKTVDGMIDALVEAQEAKAKAKAAPEPTPAIDPTVAALLAEMAEMKAAMAAFMCKPVVAKGRKTR